MASEHKQLSLKYGCISKRKVYSHLVSVKVCVERGTSQRVQLDGLALDKLRLECLDTESVQGRSTVQKNRMAFHHVLQDIPDNGILAVNHLLCTLYGLYHASFKKFPDDERLVKLSGNEFRKSALMHLEFRTYNDN